MQTSPHRRSHPDHRVRGYREVVMGVDARRVGSASVCCGWAIRFGSNFAAVRTRTVVTVITVAAVWVGVVVWSVVPPSPDGYLVGAVSSAQDAVSATGTVLLVGQADLDADLLPPYTATVLDEAQQTTATAAQDLLAAPVPDDSSEEVRQELVPLLVAASNGVTAVGTATANGDQDAARAALTALGPVREQLDQFVQDNQ